MQLLVVRHAPAEDAEDDASRRLTDVGRKKMKESAKGLRTLVPKVDLLATSPLVRATETAAILGDVLEAPEPLVVPQLSPGARPDAVAGWLGGQRLGETAAIVGHEPALSLLVSWLVAGVERPLIELKKGGACLLELGSRVAAGQALLLWLLTGGQLRNLRD
jgi:phosphohistidine phosphatase